MNWIEARYKCNARQMFVCLADRMRQDIEAWAKLSPRPIEAAAEIGPSDGSTVRITWNSRTAGVREKRTGVYIVEVLENSIYGRKLNGGEPSKEETVIVPTLNKEGKCVFVVAAKNTNSGR